MRFPRMTTRRWMVGVAIVAVGIQASRWTDNMRRRSLYYTALADRWEMPTCPKEAGASRLCDYYDGLEKKYRRAARYPWLPVAPDPPVPE